MANKLNQYLGRTGPTILKDYQHASRLYVDNNYGYAPKVGFLYYIVFNMNPNAIPDGDWKEKHIRNLGLLVKKIDLPKFTVINETLNQYNRKTVVSTKLTYTPVNVEFHDDNNDIINKLWMNYYDYYFADEASAINGAFENTKYSDVDNTYGIYNAGVGIPFFNSIDIYTLHQQNYTQITLVNPKISEWQHDNLNQAEGNKIQQNRMTVAYESVIYNYGTIQDNPASQGFSDIFYDKDPSPLQIGGNVQNSSAYVTTNTGLRPPNGTQRVFPNAVKPYSPFDKRERARAYGKIGGSNQSSNALLDIVSILAKNYVNVNGITRQKADTYNIASGVLGSVTKTAPGKYASPPNTESQAGIFTLPGGVGINIFKAFNTGVNGTIRANPAALIFPPKN